MIRDATDRDLPAILAVVNEAIATSTALWTLRPQTPDGLRDWWRERLSGGYPVIVAVDGADAFLGYGSFGTFRPFAGFDATVENSLYVEARARGRGVGRTLLAALIDRAREAGKHVMVAGIEAGNVASIALHREAGFVETGRLPQVGRKFERWLDLVFMQKMLDGR